MRLIVTPACACLTLLLLSCGQPERPSTLANPNKAEQAQTAGERQIAESFGNEFADNPDKPKPPSYEVAIATAAADQSRGLEACEQKPVAEQKSCKSEVNAAWEAASANAAASRGNSN